MNTKRGLYHKKCFSCIKCKSQVGYFNAIEGPDDEVIVKSSINAISVTRLKHQNINVGHHATVPEMILFQVYCKVCYLRFHGPGGHNKYGEKDTFPCDEESPEACIRCKGIKIFMN